MPSGQAVQLIFAAALSVYLLFVAVICRNTPAPLCAKMGFAFVFVFAICTIVSGRMALEEYGQELPGKLQRLPTLNPHEMCLSSLEECPKRKQILMRHICFATNIVFAGNLWQVKWTQTSQHNELERAALVTTHGQMMFSPWIISS